MTAPLPLYARADNDACDPLAIRSAVAAARRACPQGDFANIAEICIADAVPLRIAKQVLFDEIVAVHVMRSGQTVFRRASFNAIVGGTRQRAHFRGSRG